MTECGTTYAESTVFKTMQRMKAPEGPAYTRLDRVGRQGFRLELRPGLINARGLFSEPKRGGVRGP